MARVLIVGCGCRGRSLARELVADGHAVRGTTRDPRRAPGIAAAGAEPWVGDPNRLATLTRALEAVTVVCWTLAGATGSPDEVADLHDRRLRAYLRELVDTTVRGFVYEAAGSAGAEVLGRGRSAVKEAGATWQLPTAWIDAGPEQAGEWVAAARRAIDRILAAKRPESVQ